MPRISVSQVSTLTADFADDVRTYADAGLDAIGIWEMKLGDGPDDDALRVFRESGLGCSTAVPEVPSIHPLPLLPGPPTPRERVDAILRSLQRLAAFEPAAVACVTGPGERETVICGLREIVREAERLGLKIALEPFQLEGL
jgi:sugar phosphate isomerase/epimerase